MLMLDANMVLRYLLDDNEEMSQKAEEYIKRGDATVTTEVIAEVVYVLNGVYGMERGDITNTINDFMELVNHQDKDILKCAMDTFGKRNLDFVDCVLLAYHKLRGCEIATFDNKLIRLINGYQEDVPE